MYIQNAIKKSHAFESLPRLLYFHPFFFFFFFLGVCVGGGGGMGLGVACSKESGIRQADWLALVGINLYTKHYQVVTDLVPKT